MANVPKARVVFFMRVSPSQRNMFTHYWRKQNSCQKPKQSEAFYIRQALRECDYGRFDSTDETHVKESDTSVRQAETRRYGDTTVSSACRSPAPCIRTQAKTSPTSTYGNIRMELSQLLAPGELTGGVNRPTRWVGSRNTRPLDAAVAERQLSGLRE